MTMSDLDLINYRGLLLGAAIEADEEGVPVPLNRGYMPTWAGTLEWATDDQLVAFDHDLYQAWEAMPE